MINRSKMADRIANWKKANPSTDLDKIDVRSLEKKASEQKVNEFCDQFVANDIIIEGSECDYLKF